MKFFFQFCGPPDRRKPWENDDMLRGFDDHLRVAAHPRYQVADKERDADIVVLVESVRAKDWRYVSALENEPVIKRRGNTCVTINYDDCPLCILSGLYAGIPSDLYDPRFHRSSGYLLQRTPGIIRYAAQRNISPPACLASFRGANSHPVRTRIFDLAPQWKDDVRLMRVDRWFNHTASEEAEYFKEILASKFVLCPRGIAPSSHRLYEVMQLGRVPVIISDTWVAPTGPAWPEFSIRVAESKLEIIPELLRGRSSVAHEMGEVARTQWEKWFSPETRMVVAAGAIEDLVLARPADFDAIAELRKWTTFTRRWDMRWSFPQRAYKKLTSFL
jgi:hypothetical protein